jgi:hypothetical protein
MELSTDQWRNVEIGVAAVVALGILEYRVFVVAPRHRRLAEELARRELANIVEEVTPLNDQEKEDRRLAERQHDKDAAVSQNANSAAIKAAEEAIKGTMLVNGGSCVAMLTFVGALASGKIVTPSDIVHVAAPLFWFASGLGCALLASFCAYFTNLDIATSVSRKDFIWKHPYTETTPASQRAATRAEVARWIGIAVTVGSFACFATGVYTAKSSFEVLAKPSSVSSVQGSEWLEERIAAQEGENPNMWMKRGPFRAPAKSPSAFALPSPSGCA